MFWKVNNEHICPSILCSQSEAIRVQLEPNTPNIFVASAARRRRILLANVFSTLKSPQQSHNGPILA
jgi:hypothetical protein